MTTSSRVILAVSAPCGHVHEHGGCLGSDFVRNQRIICTSCDLGTVENGPHLRQQWALRMQRYDDTGAALADIAAEREYWTTCVHTWHNVRAFLGDDSGLLAAFFDIVPPEY